MVNTASRQRDKKKNMFKRIDHVAILVPNMEEAIQLYTQSFGVDFDLFEKNEEGGFEVASFKVGDASIELLSPTRSDSVISGMLEKHGPGIHHIGLEVKNIKKSKEMINKIGLRLTSEEPKKGSRNSKVIFIHPKSLFGTMLEIVELPIKPLNQFKD